MPFSWDWRPTLCEKGKHRLESRKLALRLVRGPLLGQCASLGLPLHPPLIPTYHSHSNLKATCLPSLEFLMAWILTFVKDLRGVSLASHVIKETSPSFILHHSSKYCYVTKFLPSLSLSLSLCFTHLFLKTLKQLCCYNLFH
jgi:hypothetical protein